MEVWGDERPADEFQFGEIGPFSVCKRKFSCAGFQVWEVDFFCVLGFDLANVLEAGKVEFFAFVNAELLEDPFDLRHFYACCIVEQSVALNFFDLRKVYFDALLAVDV